MNYIIGRVRHGVRGIQYLTPEEPSDEELGHVFHWHEDVAKARRFPTREAAVEQAKVTPPGWFSGQIFVQCVKSTVVGL